MTDLEPISIDDALNRYLQKRSDDGCTPSTLRAHKYRLGHLERWADGREDIEDTSDLMGRTLDDYRKWRCEDGDLNHVTLYTQMCTLRVFARFLATIEAVGAELPQKVPVPELDKDEMVRDDILEKDRALEILDYLGTYHYASKEHIFWLLLLGTGRRIGAISSLDVEDIDVENKRLSFVHRPDEGTTLKNGMNGEAIINIDESITITLQEYIENNREEVEDEFGRRPLVATTQGRASTGTLRRWVYRWTQPCQIGEDCPHGTNQTDCETAGSTCKPSGCPSIRNPHAVRRLVLTDYRRNDIPDEHISDRVDVSRDILDKHYDSLTEEEKADVREEWFT